MAEKCNVRSQNKVRQRARAFCKKRSSDQVVFECAEHLWYREPNRECAHTVLPTLAEDIPINSHVIIFRKTFEFCHMLCIANC